MQKRITGWAKKPPKDQPKARAKRNKEAADVLNRIIGRSELFKSDVWAQAGVPDELTQRLLNKENNSVERLEANRDLLVLTFLS